MATGIIEVFAKAGYDVRFVARGEEKVEARAGGAGQVAGQAGASKGRLSEDDRDAVARPRHAARRRWTSSPTSTWSSRPSSRSSPVKETLFADLGRDLQAGRRARHHDLAPAGDRVRHGHVRGRGRRRACTSSTRRR